MVAARRQENGGHLLPLVLLGDRPGRFVQLIHLMSDETEEQQAMSFYQQGKLVALLGGDHSTPLGLIKAAGDHFGNFGILQIDAHADLRECYEGFTYSHASVMFNVLNEVPQVEKLVQVGIRDYCDEELDRMENHPRIKTYFDQGIKSRMYEGDT